LHHRWLEKQECEKEHTKIEHINIDEPVNANGVVVNEEVEHGLDAVETKQP
jgi:CxxC motif-containing protein